MTFSDRVTEATTRIAPAIQSDLRTAFVTFEAAMQVLFTSYDGAAQPPINFSDRLIDLCRDLDAELR